MRVRLSALLGAIAIVAASCGGATTETVAPATQNAADAPVTVVPEVAPTQPAAAGESEPAPTGASSGTGAEVVAEAPAEASSSRIVNTVGGGQLDLGSIEGQDTVLWFWAPW